MDSRSPQYIAENVGNHLAEKINGCLFIQRGTDANGKALFQSETAGQYGSYSGYTSIGRAAGPLTRIGTKTQNPGRRICVGV